MRAFFLSAVALLALAAPAAAQQPAPLKFAYINSQRILAEAPGRVEAEAQFEREVVTFREQIQRMEDSLRTLAQGFERDQAAMTDTVRRTRALALQQQEATFQARADTLNQQMQRRQTELVRPIMEQINGMLSTIRAEQGYSFIFDVTAGGQPIVAADTTLDITSTVIARLRAVGPPTSSTRPSTTTQPSGVTRPRQ